MKYGILLVDIQDITEPAKALFWHGRKTPVPTFFVQASSRQMMVSGGYDLFPHLIYPAEAFYTRGSDPFELPGFHLVGERGGSYVRLHDLLSRNGITEIVAAGNISAACESASRLGYRCTSAYDLVTGGPGSSVIMHADVRQLIAAISGLGSAEMIKRVS
jgi:hypothetical protein